MAIGVSDGAKVGISEKILLGNAVGLSDWISMGAEVGGQVGCIVG